MPKDYVPSADNSFRVWAAHLSAGVSADPLAVGVTPAIAATLANKYSAFEAALRLSSAPETRGGSTILAKTLSRKDLEKFCRAVAQQIRCTISVTDQQRFDLGLTVPAQRSSIPRPGLAPRIDFISMNGHVLTMRARDANSLGRARPEFVTGLSVFSYVGDSAPSDLSQWVFEASTSKPLVQVHFDPSLAPGTKVWATCFWTNAKLESGPIANPISALIQFGSLSHTA